MAQSSTEEEHFYLDPSSYTDTSSGTGEAKSFTTLINCGFFKVLKLDPYTTTLNQARGARKKLGLLNHPDKKGSRWDRMDYDSLSPEEKKEVEEKRARRWSDVDLSFR